MALHNARTSVERIAADEPIPITFGFEITDGQLVAVTASDDEGRTYTVSIRLTSDVVTELCCCAGPDGTVKCLRLAQCNCDPP